MKCTDELQKIGWKKCAKNETAFPYAECFYQKRYFWGEKEIYAEVIEYAPFTFPNGNKVDTSFELEVYIPDEYSITGMALKIKNYTWRNEFDVDEVESAARKLILSNSNLSTNGDNSVENLSGESRPPQWGQGVPPHKHTKNGKSES